MKYPEILQEGRLIRRYKRFMADIELANGEQITLHCPNTGSMKNCLYPGHRVWYSDSHNPKRKYPCTWEQAEIPVAFNGRERMTLAGLNTVRANPLVEELLQAGKVASLAHYGNIRREVKYGVENSRIDFLLTGEALPDCYLEVKSVTLAMGDGLGLFPDAVTSRGTKHLRELMEICESGGRAVLFFCVQHTGIDRVSPADEIDPKYGAALREAIKAGVEVVAWGAELSPEGIELKRELPVLVEQHFNQSETVSGK
ncbi:DNA/RNA nuclease SfsA [Endozoicomonas montiporae]|uniref:Sugar fermentation stimulation protein homolog n=1 Tax=Endozoicomonas montiporae CL-33 TaxID=570277 RepID=A0A142BIQ7_9GAMM|nr:DNA/RNA nuclease SfsA [Endozoicomonas montiporae]AMO58633.1 sugar fermentation stimulation protein A [Endozoicomonas montiporae CL-33]